jgi:hypothetical protein
VSLRQYVRGWLVSSLPAHPLHIHISSFIKAYLNPKIEHNPITPHLSPILPEVSSPPLTFMPRRLRKDNTYTISTETSEACTSDGGGGGNCEKLLCARAALSLTQACLVRTASGNFAAELPNKQSHELHLR